MVVTLHGAESIARRGINPYLERAEKYGIILLAPDSRVRTWDVIQDGWGPDAEFIDRALGDLFGRCRIDPDQVAIEGFSDGATYALSLGVSNGDLFRKIVAFSPGFLFSASLIDRPHIFISHGIQDAVFPIDMCSRQIVPELLKTGYDVEYREFAGGHEITSDLIDESLVWLGIAAKS